MQHDRDKNSCKNLLDEGKDILCHGVSGDSPLILVPSGVLSEKKLLPPTPSNVRQGGKQITKLKSKEEQVASF